MAIDVRFYTLSKRENSTKRPDSDPVSFQCILKEPCSIISPVIALNLGLVSDPSLYNYCYIPVFDRYYFVANWTYDNALWNASLTVDVLATYKETIGSTSLYILRASAAYDGDIIDMLYPTETGSSYSTVSVNSPWTYTDIQQGAYILGIVGKTATPYGSMTYYLMDASQLIFLMRDLSDNLVDANNGFTTDDASYSLQKALIDPFTYIRSCIWFPLPYASIHTSGTQRAINAGGFDLTSTGSPLIANNPYVTGSMSFAMPQHPDTAARGNYVNAVYRNITAVVPPFGTFQIDGTVACNYTYIVARYSVDCISGMGVCELGCSNTAGNITHLLSRTESMVGVPIQISQVYRDLYAGALQTARAGVNTAASLVNLNAGGAASAAANGIIDAMEAVRPRLESFGSSGSYASVYGVPALYVQFLRPVADDPTHNGRPLCQNRTPASLGGYMLVQDGDVSIAGTQAEAAEIRAYLEGGFYYE